MNKIYKVIWSKVRNCYVAVSEIAKRNGKSCTSVNCGAKADRGRAGMALALTLSLSLAGGGVAWAEIQVPNYTYQNPIEINSDTEENFNIIEGDTTFTVKNGKVKTITSSKSGNIIEVKSGGHVYDYVSYSTHSVGIHGGISNNTVTIYGTVSYQILGGYSGDSEVTNNKVIISGGNVTRNVYGGSGYSYNTPVYGVNKNTVTISAGTISGDVYGGEHNSSSDVLGNRVEISDGTVSGFVYGGNSAGNAGGPDTIVGGQTVKNGNTVSITDGTVSKAVYGGKVGSGSGKNAINNSVTISGSSTIGTPETVTYNKNIYGGYTIGTGNATGNTVNINLVTNDKGTSDDTTDDTGVIWGTVYGGYASKGDAGGIDLVNGNTVTKQGNTVTITGGTVSGIAIGGYSEQGNALNNEVTIKGANTRVLGGVVGGWVRHVEGISATGNKVTVDDGVVSSAIYGGWAGGSNNQNAIGSVRNNNVTINGGTIGDKIIGGYVAQGKNTNTGESTGNTVTITGGQVNGDIYAGYVLSGTGAVTGNTVTIKGGTFNDKKDIYGGRSSGTGSAANNTVSISGGNFTLSENKIVAGYKSYGSTVSFNVSGNTVTLAGGSFSSASVSEVIGGWYDGNNSSSIIINNTVNLYGAVTGLNNINLYGGKFNGSGTWEGTGNELHVGGTKSGTAVTGTTLSPWTDGVTTTSGNKVKSVNNFNKIVLHKVDWSTTTPVLAAGSFSNIGILDISGMDIQGTKTLGTMALLKSDTLNSLDAITLTYNNTTAGTNKPIGTGISLATISNAGSDTSTTGVSVAYDGATKVTRDSDTSSETPSTSINYTISPVYTGATLGAMKWGEGYTFASGAVIKTGGLDVSFGNDFKVTGAENQDNSTSGNSTSMNLLDLGTSGTITGSPSKSVTVSKTNQAVTTDNKLTFSWNRTDTVATSSDGTKLVYTTGATSKVTTATFNGAIDWSTTPYYDAAGSAYTFDGDTKINDTDFAYTGTATTALKTNDKVTILNAPGLTTANQVTDGTTAGKTVLVNYKDDAGVTYSATASGHVAAAANAVNYVVDSVAATGVNLQSWNGTDTSTVITTNGWTGTGVAVATGSFAAPTDLNLGGSRTIATAPTGFFGAVTGTNAHPQNGGTLSEDTGGVKLAGSMIGGVKAEDDGTTATLTYYAMKKTADTMTLGTFAFVDGTANARTYGSEYDLTNAEIATGGLAFTEESKKAMEPGNKMTLVDASGAYKNASGETLKALDTNAKTSFDVDFTDTISGKVITFAGTHTDKLEQDAAQTKLTYTVGDKNVSTATLSGPIAWSDGGIYYTNGSDVNQNSVAATYKFDNSTDVDISGVTFSTMVDPIAAGKTKSMTLLKGVEGVEESNVSGTPAFTVTLDQTNTKLDAKATGSAGVSGNDVTYAVSGVAIDKVNIKSADGTADKVPEGWTLAAGATIETDSMTVPTVEAGKHIDILQSDTDNFFANVPINGAYAYGKQQDTFTEADATKGVTIAGTQDKGVTLNTENKHLIYKAGTMDVNSVTLGPVEWKKGATVFDRSSTGYNYAGVAALGTDGFAVSYASPETVATGDSMTLLQANATLKDMAEQVKQTSYSFAPVSGVTVDAAVTGSLEAKGGNVTYTATANQASKLTFGSVDWKDSGALMTRPSNITFAGADVDTTKIHFKNVKELDANKKMTLVSDFGDSVGTITGTKYTVGAGLEGEGAASLAGSDLVFTTKTGARDLAAQEQTHNTLMVMEAGMAVLAAGNEYVGQTMAELANPQNVSLDGTVTAASLGGSKSRYKTGSHVDSNNWNVAVAVGSKRELTKGSLEWGVFGEYGKSNYTLHSDAGRGDGDSHYAGGGLMAKWTNKHDVYTEASVRLGRLSDTANNLLRDAAGNGYGYDVHANYFGAHVGIGKIIHYKGGKSLDVYGKYFYTKRDGVDFASGGNNYSLDSVASSVLRVGARYGTTDKKWNWYGGLAYEYEFDGKSEGTVDGVGIRAASIKGGSVRGEIGLRMSATKTNPWQTDISIYGYGGKHRGFGGSVNVAYMF